MFFVLLQKTMWKSEYNISILNRLDDMKYGLIESDTPKKKLLRSPKSSPNLMKSATHKKILTRSSSSPVLKHSSGTKKSPSTSPMLKRSIL